MSIGTIIKQLRKEKNITQVRRVRIRPYQRTLRFQKHSSRATKICERAVNECNIPENRNVSGDILHYVFSHSTNPFSVSS